MKLFRIVHADGKRWRTMDTIGCPDWTDDPEKALTTTLREHVDAYAADDSEDVRIEEVVARWRSMETAVKTGVPEEVLLLAEDRHGNKNVMVCHWAFGGGEEQPRFGPAWFCKNSAGGFAELVSKPLGWCPIPISNNAPIDE